MSISHPNTTTPQVSVTASMPNAAEPVTDGEYTITRTSGTSGFGSPLTVNFGMSGTATWNSDYQLVDEDNDTVLTGSTTGNTVQILAGNSVVHVKLRVIDDSIVEPTETATLTLESGGTGYVVGVPTSATVSIADDDATTVSVTAPDANAAEPSTNGLYTITRSGGGDGNQRGDDSELCHQRHRHPRVGLQPHGGQRQDFAGEFGYNSRRPIVRSTSCWRSSTTSSPSRRKRPR